MRMLQVPELKRAMGFQAGYELNCGTRRDRIKFLGNAVCPPVMEAVVRSINCGEAGCRASGSEQAVDPLQEEAWVDPSLCGGPL
jgi:C-5 cytosine-specific DNA methylase